MSEILIKNGTIVNHNQIFEADILIENGKIKKVAPNIQAEAKKIIDAKDKYIFPGGIDPHVHFHLPFYAGFTADDFFSGTKAALYGGTTTVIDFVTPKRGENLIDAYLKRKEEAEEALINVKFHVSPVDWHDGIEKEIAHLAKNCDVSSLKIYTAYKHAIGIDDKTIIKVLQLAKDLNLLVIVHCENDEIINFLRDKFVAEGKTQPKYHALSRPEEAEAEAIERLILYAKYIDVPIYIVHVSTSLGIDKIHQAQAQGLKIYAETCPQYLLLNEDKYEADFYEAAKYVMSPPLRKKYNSQALWEHINKNTVFTIGTDHCSFNLKGQKDLGINDFRKIPNGAAGVEHRLQLLYTYGVLQNKISLQKFVEITSYNPAKLFKLENKGIIKENFDADLIIWDKNYKSVISAKTHLSKADNNIYEGMEIIGKPQIIILNGKIYENK